MASIPQELWSHPEQRRHMWRNYTALVCDGGCYFFAMAIVSAETVLPTVLQTLGAPTWLIAMAPTLQVYGFLLLPFFTVHLIERLSRFLPFVAWMSVPQRLPPLFAGLALLFWADSHPRVVLVAVALSPVVISLFGGANVTAFFELVAKVLPANRRASNFSLRNVLGTLFGLAAGGLVAAVLTRWPGATGYGVLYLFSFAGMMLSLVALVVVREVPHIPRPRAIPRGVGERLRALPRWLRDDVIARHYVFARALAFGITVLVPFLAIHARTTLGQPESFLGRLVVAQMAGAITGNLLAAWLGDRHGGRILARLGGAAGIALCVATLVNRSEAGFYAMFFALGMATYLSNTGAMVLQLELFPEERRPTYLALVSVVTLPVLLLMSGTAGVLRMWSGAIWPAAVTAGALMLASQWYYRRLPEPRERGSAPPAAAN